MIIPLTEAIQICADTLYNSELVPLITPKTLVTELLTGNTTSNEFSLNIALCKQLDGVAMGSPLDPTLANIFAGEQRQE